MNHVVEIRTPSVTEYQYLRNTTNWGKLHDVQVQSGLEASLFSVCVTENKSIIGMGRVIGDGSIYFYLQDIIVHPDYQGRGIGKKIMDAIENYLKKTAGSNSFIGLMAAEGVSEFYASFQYKAREEEKPGMYKVIPPQ